MWSDFWYVQDSLEGKLVRKDNLGETTEVNSKEKEEQSVTAWENFLANVVATKSI